jgi:hypothetical protein
MAASLNFPFTKMLTIRTHVVFVAGLKVLWDEFHGFIPCFDSEEKLSFSHFGIL